LSVEIAQCFSLKVLAETINLDVLSPAEPTASLRVVDGAQESLSPLAETTSKTFVGLFPLNLAVVNCICLVLGMPNFGCPC
jgi:hypothetical protein